MLCLLRDNVIIPMHFLPSEDTSKPGGQTQRKLPGELVQRPPWQMSGFKHSSISAKRDSNRHSKQGKNELTFTSLWFPENIPRTTFTGVSFNCIDAFSARAADGRPEDTLVYQIGIRRREPSPWWTVFSISAIQAQTHIDVCVCVVTVLAVGYVPLAGNDLSIATEPFIFL